MRFVVFLTYGGPDLGLISLPNSRLLLSTLKVQLLHKIALEPRAGI